MSNSVNLCLSIVEEFCKTLLTCDKRCGKIRADEGSGIKGVDTMLCIGNKTMTEQEFEELVEKYYPDNLSDPALVEAALNYERMMSAKKKAS